MSNMFLVLEVLYKLYTALYSLNRKRKDFKPNSPSTHTCLQVTKKPTATICLLRGQFYCKIRKRQPILILLS